MKGGIRRARTLLCSREFFVWPDSGANSNNVSIHLMIDLPASLIATRSRPTLIPSAVRVRLDSKIYSLLVSFSLFC